MGAKISTAGSNLKEYEISRYLSTPPKSRIEGLTMIFRDNLARTKYIEFLQRVNTKPSFAAIPNEIERLKFSSPVEVAKDAKAKVSKYAGSNCVGELQNYVLAHANSIIEGDRSICANGISADDMIEQSLNEVIVLLLVKLLPSFMLTKEYKEWSSAEGSMKMKHISRQPTPEDIRSDPIDFFDLINAMLEVWRMESRIRQRQIYESKDSDEEEDCIDNRARRIIEIPTIQSYLNTYGWVNTLCRVMENLPICCSIADADNLNPGFPLIYVNRKFENVTGYSLSDVKGLSCKFLQGPKTEPDAVSWISSSLQSASPIRVQITNYRKDKSSFLNLFYMAPVVDLNGKYCYVVAVQCDCSDTSESKVDTMHLIDFFISVLPTVCPIWKSIS